MNVNALEAYIHSFYGYGALDSPLWFIGYEESDDSIDFSNMLSLWEEEGKPAVTEIHRLHPTNPHVIPDENGEAKFQITLGRITRTYLSYCDKSWTDDLTTDEQNVIIKKHQATLLGRFDGKCALLELYPLPNQNRKVDLDCYKKFHVSLPYLAGRDTYEATIKTERVEFLKKQIVGKNPKIVFDYTNMNIFSCGKVVKIKHVTKSNKEVSTGVKLGKIGNTAVVSCGHFCSGWFTNDFPKSLFLKLGELELLE